MINSNDWLDDLIDLTDGDINKIDELMKEKDNTKKKDEEKEND